MLPAVLTKNRIAIGIILLACLCLLGTYLLVIKSKHAAPPSPEVGDVVRTEALPSDIEVADTAEKRTLGLSGRTSIADDYGLLFLFSEDGRHGFWMKDMQFAIDIIWIDADGRIVHIEQALAPSTYPTIFTPIYPARYVLEARAGYAQDRGWKVGTQLDLSAHQQ